MFCGSFVFIIADLRKGLVVIESGQRFRRTATGWRSGSEDQTAPPSHSSRNGDKRILHSVSARATSQLRRKFHALMRAFTPPAADLYAAESSGPCGSTFSRFIRGISSM